MDLFGQGALDQISTFRVDSGLSPVKSDIKCKYEKSIQSAYRS